MREYDIRQRWLLVIAFIISLLYIFTIAQVDCNTITTWGYDLLDSVRAGRLRDYPVFTYEMHNMPSNYSLFDNVITAIWLIPAYLLGSVAGLFSDMIIYDTWYKLLILIIYIIDLYLFDKILKALSFDSAMRGRALMYYMLSGALCVTVLGKGQIDIYSVTLGMIAIIFFLNHRYIGMSIAFGVSLLIKPFIILFIVPFYLLMISKVQWKIVLYGIITLIPYAIDAIITRLLMPRYIEMKDLTSQMFKDTFGTSRVEEIFSLTVNHVLVFFAAAVVICFICLRLGRLKTVKDNDYLFYPTLLYVCYALFVSDACYWFIVIVPALIIMGLKMKHIEDFELLYFGSNMGSVLYIYFLEQHLRPGSNYTLFDKAGLVNKPFVLYEALSSNRRTVYEVGATLFTVCMLVICILFFLEMRGKIRQSDAALIRETLYSKICIGIQFVPVVLYLVINYITLG